MRVNSYLAFYACAVNYEELLLFMHAFLNKFHSEMDKIIKDHNNCESRRKAKANKSKNCERRKNQENESDRADHFTRKNYAKLPYDIARIGEREERKPFISSWSNSA
jgi:hypothetical protein